jgi:dTDP-4-amino-4,6-dideoxygalactose transaminase
MIPYGRQTIDDADIQAVVDVLQSDYLTTGPAVERFEAAVCRHIGAGYAAAVSSGTAALHCALKAIGIGHGDEVIVPAITFAATANAVVYCGGLPVFADVCPDTLLIDPVSVEERITPRTRAIVAVDYAGQPCDYDVLQGICNQYDLILIADACHSIGGSYKGRPVGSLADLTCFSFHPVKAITTGEGGMVVTDNPHYSCRIDRFRNHGRNGLDMVAMGHNYRLSDIHAALGISQLSKLDGFVERRRQIANQYRHWLPLRVMPLAVEPWAGHAYHLFVIQSPGRDKLRARLADSGIGTQIHYCPVHLLAYYWGRLGYKPGICPVAESAYFKILSLPIYPGLSDNDVDRICEVINS